AALKRSNIPVRIADIGPVSKVDVIDASITKKEDPYLGVIIAFNVKIHPEAEEEAKRLGVKIFQDNVIYRLLEDYEKWVEEEKQRERMRKLSELVRPGKFRILPGFIFRRSDPAIVGIKVEGGVIRPGYPVMDEDGRPLGRILAIRDRDRSLPEARLGMEVAVSIQGRILIGRHVDEGDILYTNVPAEHARKLVVEFKDLLSKDELDVLKEIAEIKRRQGDIGYAGVLMKLKSMKA
ncbi:MAG: translation initiation factor IF-2, partial [Desulfurococcales archaeon]|nr:translation initiation factor IF-2 [Desulfurococcales archaeon]